MKSLISVPLIVEKRETIWLLLLSLCLILVAMPRFDRREFREKVLQSEGAIPLEMLGDAIRYTALTEHFRGNDTERAQLVAPFTYRLLVPLIASWLPFEAITAINVVNVFFLLLGLLFLYKLLTLFELSFPFRIAGCGMYVFSFPLSYYGTIGYVDPVLISFLFIGTYMLFTSAWIWLYGVFAMGLLVKESIILLIPVTCVYLFLSRRLWCKEALIIPLMTVTYVVESHCIRSMSPGQPGYLWLPSMNALVFNIQRLHGWLSFLLSFGVPGVLSLLLVRYRAHRYFTERAVIVKTLLSGLVVSLALVLFSVVSAYADGRMIWTSYPFTIPLAVMVLDHFWRARMLSADKEVELE